MADYKKFFIKQQTYDGSNYTDVDGSVKDIYDEFGIVCQDFPFKYFPEKKDPAKREWPDEDGEDVFIPSGGLKTSAFDIEVKFLYAGAVYGTDVASNSTTMYAKIVNFIDFITCKDVGGRVMLAMSDEYTGLAFQGVYVKEVGNELYEYNDVNLNGYAVFKVKFRVTDPVAIKYFTAET